MRRADLGATWRDADDDTRRDWRRDGIVPLDYPDPVAADWPELLAIVEERVKPERDVQNPQSIARALVALRRETTRALLHHRGAGSGVGDIPCVASFCLLRSCPSHRSSQNDDDRIPFRDPRRLLRPPIPPPRNLGPLLRIVHEGRPSIHSLRLLRDFPIPENWESRPALEAAGGAYYDYRAALMVESNEGTDKDLQPFSRSGRARSPDCAAPRVARRNGPRRAPCLRLG